MFYGYSSHYSLSCIFTSPDRMCKHSLHSLIVKIPFPITIKTSPSDVISITDSPATMRMNFRMIADCYHGNTCRECNNRESTANGRGSRVTFIFCSVSMDGGSAPRWTSRPPLRSVPVHDSRRRCGCPLCPSHAACNTLPTPHAAGLSRSLYSPRCVLRVRLRACCRCPVPLPYRSGYIPVR